MYKKISGLVVSLTAVFACAAWAEVPAGYPADYQKTIDAAVKEGKVVIYSTTDTKAAGPLIKGFEAQYPGVKVEYNDMNSTELYNRYISEQAAGGGSGDVVWSSSMDTALKLATEYAEQYASPEVKQLPDWAVWQQKAYGTTYEPVVFIYNKRLIPQNEVPIRIPRWQNLSPARPINLKAKSPPTISKNRASALCWRYRTARPTRTILPTWRISPKAA
ncbi:ABC transporter substrate-binding protein [Klebsiella pneumoniae]|uniref:ABC transporter substrate-binding protein n=1 Tax=Klebsiella pneumoniae TaxID=573 RepID=UPI003D06A065